MVRNKKGQIFALVLVPIVLFLCGVVLVLYVAGQENIQPSVVSPSSVLGLRDNLSVFELREVELIKSSLGEASGEFGSDEFKSSFRNNFIDGFMENDAMKDFLFEDLFFNGVEIREQDKDRSLLSNLIYPEVLGDEDGVTFGRTKIEIRKLLVAKDESKIDFPVYFTFEFEREYLINKEGEVLVA